MQTIITHKKQFVKDFKEIKPLVLQQAEAIAISSNLKIHDVQQIEKYITPHKWEPMVYLTGKPERALDQSKIYLHSKKSVVKHKENAGHNLRVYIGDEIMQLLGMSPSNRLQILIDANSPNYLRFVQSTFGYKIHRPSHTKTCNVSFKYRGVLLLKEILTHSVPFELFSDGSFMIDVNSAKR